MNNQVTWTKEELLSLSFSGLIIRVQSIEEKFGKFDDFIREFDLYGVTNGKLLLMIEMMQPPFELIEKVEKHLLPLGFKKEQDFIFAYELPSIEFGNKPSPHLYREHPDCKEISWLGSLIHENGNYIWLNEGRLPQTLLRE